MSELTKYQLMDIILRYLAKEPDKGFKNASMIAKGANLTVKESAINMCCNKMTRDGYLQKASVTTAFVIKFEGIELIEDGGYVELQKLKKLSWWQEWPKRRWYFYDAIKIAATALLTVALTKACDRSNNRGADKTTTELPSSK